MPRPTRTLAYGSVAVLLVIAGVAACRSSRAVSPEPVRAAADVVALPSPPPLPIDGIPFVDAHAGPVQTSSAANAWGGVRTGAEPTLSDRVVDYRIEARLNPEAHMVIGHERLTWRNRSDREVKSVYLHLYLNAFEGEGSTFFSEQRAAGFEFRSNLGNGEHEWGHCQLPDVEQQGVRVPWYFVHPDAGPLTDHSVVRFDLPVPVAAGGETTLDIDFIDQLPRVIARTGYFGSFHLVGQWFPKIGVLELPGERGATSPRWNVHEFHLHSEFYADFGHYDVSIDVPDDYTVGATGAETTAPLRAAGRVVHHFVQGDVHDFAWTADNRTAAPLEGTFTQAEGDPRVRVKVLFPPEYADNAQPALKATLDSLAYFSKTLGPYPYGTVTVVVPPYNAEEAGGMEYPTFLTADSFSDVTPGTLPGYMLKFVTIHEFGHGYFYGVLASNEFEEPMLDEGLNEYWDLRMLRDRGEKIPLTTRLLKRLGFAPSVAVFDLERLGAQRDDPVDGLGANAWDRLSSASYGSVYAGTPTVLRDLERAIGKDVMEKAFKAYYARWKFRHPSIADLRDVLVEVSGQPATVDALFAMHVYAATKVDDSVESLVSTEELPLLGTTESNGMWSEVTGAQRKQRVEAMRKTWKQTHRGEKSSEPGPFPYRTTVVVRRRGASVSQTLTVKFADASSETVKWNDDSRWKRFSWLKPVAASWAEIDPKALHRVDVSRIDDSLGLRADGRASRRVTADVGAFIQLLLALIATL